MPLRCVVTGASGFVGHHLCERLQARGHHVTALLRTPSAGPWHDQHVVDLAQGVVPPAALDGAALVFHLAGRAHAVSEVGETDVAYEPVNVGGTAALLEAATRAGVRGFVLASSVKAAGTPPAGPGDESTATEPDTPYGRSKQAAEQLVLAAGRETGLHVCVLRPTLVYGPGVKGNLAAMLAAVDRGRFPPLPDVGNRRSLVGVRDVAAAFELAAVDPRAAGRTYVVTDGQVYSTRRIHELMAAALGRPLPRWTVPPGLLRGAGRAGDVVGRLRGRRFPLDSLAVDRLLGSAEYSSRRIENELGFVPEQDLARALPEMVASYRAADATR